MTTKVPGSMLVSPGRKNTIINGGFNIWQRGTSFAAIANGTYGADQWQYEKSGAMVHTVSRSTDVPTVAQAGRLFNYSLLVDCTTVDAAIAAGDYCFVQQKIEGYNFLPLAQRAMTLSFWVKATKTGIYCVAFRNSTADRSYVAEYTVNAADTWEHKTVTVSASPSAGTWDYTSGIGLRVAFTLAVGSTFHTTAGAWQTGSFFGTANQVNATDSTSNNFHVASVQLEPGSVATEIEQRTFQEELALCMRYYEKTYDYATVPGTASTGLGSEIIRASGTTLATASRYKVTKRVAATVTIYNPNSGATGSFRNNTAGSDFTPTVAFQGETGFVTDTAAATDQAQYNWHYAATAEL